MAAQAKLEAFRQYAESNKYSQLDVRDPSIRCAIASLYSGEQVMSESFPCVSQAFDKAFQILPVKKNKGAALPINICYNRTPLSEEDIDYTYPESFNPTTGKQRLRVPLAADVALDEANSNPFYKIDITTFTLKMDSGKGFAQYITEGREDEVISAFTKTDQGFSFNLNEEWKADVPSSRLPARDRIDLYFSVAFQRQNGTLGSLDFSSRRSETSGSNVFLGWLNLLWGCVAKGTLVRMADGFDRPIENLRVGDLLMDTQGFVRIINIIKGIENTMWAVRTESGLELRCSEGHPILTDRGMVAIEKLRGDMKLIDAEGMPQAIVGIWKESYGGEVYNLVTSFEDYDEFIANGLVVGGQAAQGQLAGCSQKIENLNCGYYSNSIFARR